MDNNKDIPTSRKWILTIAILIIASIMCFVPPVIATCFFHTTLVVLSGELWVSTMLIITGGYHLSNVYQHKIELTAENLINKIPGGSNDRDSVAK